LSHKIPIPIMQGPFSKGSQICALLGATNTGKTYQAIERLLYYGRGIIGLPLRLLAREVYEQLVNKMGVEKIALLTGEERIEPRDACIWVATVESMPLQYNVPFVVVDEIQLASHPKRGHVFTDRILHARGSVETWFLVQI
jgi:ATP-dependent RNA helicase SUPV3L1/SUV3